MGNIQTLEDVIALLRRRKWLVVPVFLLGALLSLAAALARPQVYESVAVIQVEMPLVAQARVPLPSAQGPSQSLQQIEQRLMARDNVLGLIARYGLFDDAPGLTQLERIAALRLKDMLP